MGPLDRLRLRRRVDAVAAGARAPLLPQLLAEVQDLPKMLHTGAVQLAADCAAGAYDAAGIEAVVRLRNLALFMTACEEKTADLLAAMRLQGSTR